MPLQQLLHHGLVLRGLLLEVGARPTAPLRRVARQLHAVDREHLPPDQPLRVADRHTAAKTRAMSSPRALTKWAIVVKCGA